MLPTFSNLVCSMSGGNLQRVTKKSAKKYYNWNEREMFAICVSPVWFEQFTLFSLFTHLTQRCPGSFCLGFTWVQKHHSLFALRCKSVYGYCFLHCPVMDWLLYLSRAHPASHPITAVDRIQPLWYPRIGGCRRWIEKKNHYLVGGNPSLYELCPAVDLCLTYSLLMMGIWLVVLFFWFCNSIKIKYKT